MKKSIFSFAALLLAACTAFISCNTEILQPDDNSGVGNDTYTLTVVATKGDAATKALTLSDKTLNATWSEGDVVEVYENDNHLGTLTTSNFSSDYRTCTLSCKLTTPPTGNTLTLKYRSQNYTSQDGTLAYIASYCDYAEATITVTVNDKTFTSSAPANFVNQQAIVKFVLKDESGNTLSPTKLTIANSTTTVASLPSINSAIYEATANGPGTLFVAIPEVSDDDLSLTAVSSGKTYVFKKSAVTLSNGTYKIITVKMYNELETPLTFEAKTAGATVTLTADPNISFGDNVQYSTDGSTWTTYPSGTGITLENVGNKVQFRGTLTTYSNSTSTGSTFSVSDDCYVYGNVMSLIGGDSFASVTTLPGELTFSRLFLSETKNTKIQSHAYKTIALPATTLTQYCYFDMFFGCSGLTSAPKLPAKTLAHACYENMFYNCSGLTSAPELPATTLADYCYAAMFGRCSGLTSVPTLQASTLKKACYSRLFEGCTGLSTVPTNLLPATKAEMQCYEEMFSGCTNLTNVPNLPATNLSTRCYDGMFKGCTSLTALPADLLPATDLSSASYCYSGMFRNTGLTSVPSGLLPATTLSQDCYSSMFHSCSNLQNTPNLSAENLASRCYASMFCYCSSLTSGPTTLPATTLQNSCYYEMFSSCSNLASCPSLPATTLAQSCYEDMFSYCSNLLSGPNLPATTLAQNCYKRMFVSCHNMTTMGTISATTLAANCCANMFHYCSNLKTAPALLATTLADNCYESMFEACSRLTSLPSSLPASTLAPNCYKNMFSSCTSLTTVPADFLPATTLSASCYYHMFKSCTKLTTAPNLPATTIAPNCYYEMFSRCTDLVTVPTALPATDLTDATFCYSGMFLECTKLETAPNLPATTLSNNCYYAMFKGCSKLKSVTCLATGISESNYLNYTDKWLNGVASTGTFTKAAGVAWPRNNNGIPAEWDVNEQ